MIWCIVFLSLIVFSIEIEGINEIDKIQTDIIQIGNEATGNLKYLNEHWSDIPVQYQEEITQLYKQLKNFERELQLLNAKGQSVQINLENQTVFLQLTVQFNQYLKNVILNYHKIQQDKFNKEIGAITAASSLIEQCSNLIREKWQLLPETLKTDVLKKEKEVAFVKDLSNAQMKSNSLKSSSEMLANRSDLRIKLEALAQYFYKVVQHLKEIILNKNAKILNEQGQRQVGQAPVVQGGQFNQVHVGLGMQSCGGQGCGGQTGHERQGVGLGYAGLGYRKKQG